MSVERITLDTNVLFYAVANDAGGVMSGRDPVPERGSSGRQYLATLLMVPSVSVVPGAIGGA
jgi:hypothetical protein